MVLDNKIEEFFQKNNKTTIKELGEIFTDLYDKDDVVVICLLRGGLFLQLIWFEI